MKNLIYIPIIVLLFSSCDEDFFTKVIKVDAEKHESLISLNGHFTNQDSVYRILVANSLGIVDTSSYSFFEDARVELFEDNNLIADFVFNAESNYYEYPDVENLELKAATNYTIKVDVPDYPSVEVSQQMPSVVEIESVALDYGGGVDQYGEQSDVVTIKFTDDGATEDFYELEVFSIGYYVDSYLDPDTGEIIEDTIQYNNHAYLQPDGLTGERGYAGTVVFNDKVFNGKTFNLRALGWLPFDHNQEITILAKLSNITADRYYYQVSYGKYYEADGNPFAEPVIIHENVPEGHGVFTLGSQSVKEVIE